MAHARSPSQELLTRERAEKERLRSVLKQEHVKGVLQSSFFGEWIGRLIPVCIAALRWTAHLRQDLSTYKNRCFNATAEIADVARRLAKGGLF